MEVSGLDGEALPKAVDLLVVDELGHLPLTERAAELLFQAFSARHEPGSVIVNSNLSFSD